VIDPNEIELETEDEFSAYFIQKSATEGMTEIYKSINKLA
jgi:hypothetical protein